MMGIGGNKTTSLDYTSVPLYGLFVYLGQSEGEKGESSWLIPGSQNGNLKLYTLKKTEHQVTAFLLDSIFKAIAH